MCYVRECQRTQKDDSREKGRERDSEGGGRGGGGGRVRGKEEVGGMG